MILNASSLVCIGFQCVSLSAFSFLCDFTCECLHVEMASQNQTRLMNQVKAVYEAIATDNLTAACKKGTLLLKENPKNDWARVSHFGISVRVHVMTRWFG